MANEFVVRKGLIVSGSSRMTGSLEASSYISASSFSGSFLGDGSQLYNLPAADVSQVATVTASFTDQTSVSVSHNFSTKNVIISVYDTSDAQIIPESVTLTNNNTATIGFPSIQSGYVVVAKGGHIVSGSATNAENLNSQPGSYYLDYTNFTNIPSGLVSGSSQISFNGITDKPSLVSGSSQISYPNLSNIPSGIISGSSQVVSSLNNQNVNLGTGTLTAAAISGSFNIPDSSVLQIGSQIIYPQGTNGFSVNEDFDASNSSTQTAYHYTSGTGRETVAFTLARTGQFTNGFGIYGTSANNTFVTFGEQANTKFEWRRGVGIRPLDLDGGTLLATLTNSGSFSTTGGITGSFSGDGSQITFGGTNIISGSSQITDLTTYKQTITGSSSYAVTHNLNEQYPIVQCWNTSTNRQEIPSEVESNSVNQITVTFSSTFSGVVIVKK